MVDKSFKPMLAPNEEVDLSTLKYPIFASNKLDGMRIVFNKGQILTRSLKPLPNKQLNTKFEIIRKWTEETGNILDGEIYSPQLTFQEIISFCMTDDLTESKTVKKNKGILEIPDHLNFYCFDALYGGQTCHPFNNRIKMVQEVALMFPTIMILVEHELLDSEVEVRKHFTYALKGGCEGLILRDPFGRYKYGRGTIKEGLIYKVKPFVTLDAQIIGVVQATEVNEEAEKKINELGRSVTSKKKDDRHTIDKASAFMVYYKDKELKVTLSMTDEEKKEVWLNKESYIGKWIEYKSMKIGMKEDGLPRHPVMLRFRTDK